MSLSKITEAKNALRLLNGVFCIYKPPDLSYDDMIHTIQVNLTRDLNGLKCPPPRPYVLIEADKERKGLAVKVRPRYSDSVFVIGDRYKPKDIKIQFCWEFGKRISGVLVGGINLGFKAAEHFTAGHHLRAYQISGEFGIATDTQFTDGKVMERSTYKHIKKPQLDRALSIIQSNHQQQMFNYIGVDRNSQTAYELAAKGPIRPDRVSQPLIYSIKCIAFAPPHFTLEMHCINEREDYLCLLIHEIGMGLKSTATCSKIRCVRYGYFTPDHALVRPHWTLENFINNIAESGKLIDQHGGLQPTDANLTDKEKVGNKETRLLGLDR